MASASFARGLAVVLVTSAHATASWAEDAPCGPIGSREPRYASAVFNRGDGELAGVIGNAFAVYAEPLPLCGEPGAAPCAAPPTSRTWELTLITAAHVVQDMCSNSSDVWASAGGKFVEGRLSLLASEDAEFSRAEIKVTDTWCAREDIVKAKDQLVRLDERLARYARNKKIVVEGDVQPDEARPDRSDIFMFKQRFELPVTAIAEPFSVQFLPYGETSLELTVKRFSRLKGPSDRLARFPESRSFFYGPETGDYSATKPYQSYGYEMKLKVLHGTSGSPVGVGVKNRFVVVGVVTDTGAITCAASRAKAEAEQARELAVAQGKPLPEIVGDDGPSIQSAEDDFAQAGKVCDYGDAKSYQDIAAETGYFMPILRYPSMYEFAREREANVRVDVAVRLYNAALAADRQSKSFLLHRNELRRVMRELSPLEQALVLLRSKQEAADVSSDLTCQRLEPRDMDFWR